MSRIPPADLDDRDLLGDLAMQFRGTRDPHERESIARRYAQAVERLIRSGVWQEAPSLEDMLPDEAMPESFFAYWIQSPTPQEQS